MHFCLSSTLKNRHKTGTKASVCDVLREKVYKTPVLPVHIVNEAFWKRCVFKRLLKAFLCLLYRQPVAFFSELISAQWAQRRLITRFILENAMVLMDVTKRGIQVTIFSAVKIIHTGLNRFCFTLSEAYSRFQTQGMLQIRRGERLRSTWPWSDSGFTVIALSISLKPWSTLKSIQADLMKDLAIPRVKPSQSLF